MKSELILEKISVCPECGSTDVEEPEYEERLKNCNSCGYTATPERFDRGEELVEVSDIEEFARTHRQKFTEYWGLKEDEEKLLEDFVEQFCRFVSGEAQEGAMKKVIDDILEDSSSREEALQMIKKTVSQCQSCEVDNPEEADEGDLCPECSEDWNWFLETFEENSSGGDTE